MLKIGNWTRLVEKSIVLKMTVVSKNKVPACDSRRSSDLFGCASSSERVGVGGVDAADDLVRRERRAEKSPDRTSVV